MQEISSQGRIGPVEPLNEAAPLTAGSVRIIGPRRAIEALSDADRHAIANGMRGGRRLRRRTERWLSKRGLSAVVAE